MKEGIITPLEKTNKIEKAITNHYGKRCPDYEKGCPICEAWKEYDDLKKLKHLKKLKEDLKRTIRNNGSVRYEKRRHFVNKIDKIFKELDKSL